MQGADEGLQNPNHCRILMWDLCLISHPNEKEGHVIGVKTRGGEITVRYKVGKTTTMVGRLVCRCIKYQDNKQIGK